MYGLWIKNLELDNLFLSWFWSRWMTQMKVICLNIVLGAISYSEISFIKFNDTLNPLHTPEAWDFPKRIQLQPIDVIANTQAAIRPTGTWWWLVLIIWQWWCYLICCNCELMWAWLMIMIREWDECVNFYYLERAHR